MLISIVVPVYNVEKYLHQCIDSILEQDYEQIEIVLVDDGSTDNSGTICDEYAKKYSNIKVIHKTNAGLGMARNTGLEHVTGKYVTFLDSDDYIEKNLVSTLYTALKKNNVDVCKSGFVRVSDEKEKFGEVKYAEQLFIGDATRFEFMPRLIGSQPNIKDSIEMCVCAVMYNTEIIKKHNIKFPSEREYISEDLVFNIDYMQYAEGVCTISYVGYNYRLNPKSLTKKYRPDRFEACCFFYKEMYKKLRTLGYDDSISWRLQRMFFVYMTMCISQEKKKISNFTMLKSIRNIKKMCNDECVRDILREYPVKMLGIKQKVFVYMVKYKMAFMLYVCSLLNII